LVHNAGRLRLYVVSLSPILETMKHDRSIRLPISPPTFREECNTTNRDYFASILSQLSHLIAFSFKKPMLEFETASLIVSIDVDVGSEEVGVKNNGSNDRNVHNFLTEREVGRIEEQVVPLLVQAFDEEELPVTFALRGQLTEVENSIVSPILEASTRHDIGAHGYSHKVFTTLSEAEADKELSLISTGMRKFGIIPKSFVFPKNEISHLPLLEKYGYLSFRGRGTFIWDGMYVKKCGNLFDVHPSLYLGKFYDLSFSKKIIDLAAKLRSPFHVWFHPWNLGNSPEIASKRVDKVLLPLIRHAKEKKKHGMLRFETMRSIAEKYGNK
jgi:peptidoglycan/xylan/chitin deacetylase (PgdA/CDA1 family)